MKKYLISTLTAATAMAVPAFASGDGTKDNPYTGSISDFNPNSSEGTGGVVYIQNITSGHWAKGSDNALTISVNLDISYDPEVVGSTNGITLNNAYSDTIYTFTGTITGNGDWTFSYGSGTPTQHYIFTGDLSNYSGNFSMTAGSSSNSEGYLQFGDGGKAATNTNVSGTGSITEATNGSGFAVIYNYGSLASGGGDAITIGNTSITTQDLRFTGSVSYDVSSTLAGAGSNATLAISTEGTVTVTGSVSGFKSITVESGSTLAVGESGSLNLSGTTVDLASAIQNSGTVTLDTSTVFVLEGLTANSSATVTLISGSSGTITGYESLGTSNVSSSDFTITGATFTVASGTLSVTVSTGGYTDGLHGSGSVSSPYFTTGGTSSSKTTVSFDVSNFTGAGTTLYLATDEYSFGNSNENIYWSTSVNAECDIVIGGAGVYLTNGSSGNVHTFSGKISGTGNWTVTGEGTNTGAATVPQHYAFTGDLSEWTGSFSITTSNSYDYLVFGGTINGVSDGAVTGVTGTQAATNTSVSGNGGSIAVDHGVVYYAYTAGVGGNTGETLTVTNSSIEAHTITFAGGVNYDVSSNLIGWDGSSSSGASTTTDSTLTISTAGTVTVRGSVSDFDHIVVSSGSGLTVAAGASVTLKSGGDLTVNSGATLTLNTSIAASAGTVEFASGASLVLTDAFLASAIATYAADEAVTITIITASAIYYNDSDLSNADALEGFASIVSTSDNYELSNWTYENGTLSASVTYLPEPSMFGLMFGLGAIGLVGIRRRRR